MGSTHGQLEQAIFGGGCFWCQEAVFELVPGVVSVTNGYAGGSSPHPDYELVCTGKSGHIEVVKIQFDPAKVSFEDLLGVFFASHDPSSKDRQGADAGIQYRSVVFWVTPAQRDSLTKVIAQTEAKHGFRIVTESRAHADFPFWPAEDYHQHYFARHPDQAYCRMVIKPKVAHFVQDFKALLDV